MSKRPLEETMMYAPPGASRPPQQGRENGAGGPELAAAPRRHGGRDGKPPMIIYREGEPIHGMHEYWRAANGQTAEIEVLISPEYLTRDNQRVKSRQIWGDLVYTWDSDLVAVLMHLGYYTTAVAHAPSSIVEAHVIIRLTESEPYYPSKQRFVKSRAWLRPTDTCAYTVERVWLVTRSGCAVELSRCVDPLPALQPTVQPQSGDRYITTRNTGAKGKAAQDVSVQFNLCNEPWLKYSLAAIADKGLKSNQLTSARLVDHVLLLETAGRRYQIARLPVDDDTAVGAPGATTALPGAFSKDMYSFSRCLQPLPASAMQRAGLPLPASLVEVVEATVEWEDFQWGVASLHLKGVEYALKRVHLMKACAPASASG